MVYLAITPEGFREILKSLGTVKTSVWCGADALSMADFDQLERGNVTRFDYPLAGADKTTMLDALSSIEEHHPGERIWIEHAASWN